METQNLHFANTIQLQLESLAYLLGKDFNCLDSIFLSYEVNTIPKDENEIEFSINTDFGLINITVKNTISNECLIFPTSLDIANTITDKCNELFLKVSEAYWLNAEGNIRIKRKKVYGLCYYYSFELVKL